MRRHKRRGSVVVLVAVLMVVLLGFGAFAVDVAQMQAYKSELRRTADAAALAATQELLSNPPGAGAAAATYVAANPVMGDLADSVEYTYGIYDGSVFTAIPPAQAAQANAFRVSVRSDGDFYLAQLIGGDDFEVNARATAWLPVSTTQCVKPWAIQAGDLTSNLGTNWQTLPLATLRLMSDSLSAKVFILKGDIAGSFSGIVNLPAYFDATVGLYYLGGYSANTYTQSISSGCPIVNVNDTLQTKIGGYNPETTNGILGSLPGLTPLCSFLQSTVCFNPGGQWGVAVRVPVVELIAPDPNVGCTTNPRDPNDNYGSVGAPEVVCARVITIATFVMTRAVLTASQTLVYASYAGDDTVGPVNGFAQRPILVQ